MSLESYDYVVIGSGSAGSAVAGLLSENPDATVAVLEAGSESNGRIWDIPRLFALQFKTTFDWDFQSEPEPSLGNRRSYLPRGRVIGGTSAMNNQLYVRGARSDYDGWRDLGLPGWGYDDVLPFFTKYEDNERWDNRYHGVGGPLSVSDSRCVDPLLQTWVAAALEAGHQPNEDFNGDHQEGVGYFQLTQKNGLRWSSAKAFLDPARSRPNLTVLTFTQALAITWSGTRATGIVVEQLGQQRTIGVNKEVVLSAGVYMSPHLLLHSGVGPAEELQGHGIEVTIDLPAVGKNLQDHPGCFISLPAVDDSPFDPNTGPDEDLLMREGTGPMTWTEVGGFVKTDPGLAAPDLQYHAALGIVPADGLSAGSDRGIGFGPYVSRPLSRGAVTLRSAIPQAKPRITNNLLSDPADWLLLRRGVQISMEIASQSAWAGSGLRSVKDAADAGLAPRSTSDPDVDDFLRSNTFSFYHGAGSCSMGAVVDERLRLYGADNVRVADASVMPRVLTGNLNGPSIMIGARAAHFLLEDA